MKSQLGLLITILASLTSLANAAPIQITCGDTKVGHAVVFDISPLTRNIKATSFKDGVSSAMLGFQPTDGIYDFSQMDFSGRNFLSSSISIHASYAQILRINHFGAITIHLSKNSKRGDYTLQTFSSGYEITSTYDPSIAEQSHPMYLGLPCVVVGMQ